MYALEHGVVSDQPFAEDFLRCARREAERLIMSLPLAQRPDKPLGIERRELAEYALYSCRGIGIPSTVDIFEPTVRLGPDQQREAGRQSVIDVPRQYLGDDVGLKSAKDPQKKVRHEKIAVLAVMRPGAARVAL